uniref:ATP-dependent Clp protease proteolytic subunit n=1 Tax=Octactis speculum TaxID=3111310 RepID=A0A7S2MKF4_9STRA
MYVCSGGGQVYPGLSIIDVMEYISSPVHTICVGHAESMAAILVAAGAHGHRHSMPHSRFMLHEPSVGMGRNTTTDLLIQAKEFEQTRERLVEVLAKHTTRTRDTIISEIERNHYMSPTEATCFGLIDGIIAKREIKYEPTGKSNSRSIAEKTRAPNVVMPVK